MCSEIAKQLSELRKLVAVVKNDCVDCEKWTGIQGTKYIFSFPQGPVKRFLPLTGYKMYQAVFCPLERGYSNEQMPTYRPIVTLRVTFLKADILLISSR